MVSYLLSKDTRYRLMLQGFYFNKSNQLRMHPALMSTQQNEESKEFEYYCKFPERNRILQFDKNTVSRFSCHVNCTLLLLIYTCINAGAINVTYQMIYLLFFFFRFVDRTAS